MSHDPTPAPLDAERIVSRRSVTAAAAWTVPVVAVAVATPSAAASPDTAGAFQMNGTCGLVGVLNPGFVLQASATAPLPQGTTITITRGGGLNVGVFDVTGGAVTLSLNTTSTKGYTLTAPLAAGASISFRTLLQLTVATTVITASVTLPAGYVAGAGAKAAGTLTDSLLISCAEG
ncbi:hypothetical protein [Rathayibacter sp. VKM Ac-2630]|uniref:hypothetical protein n=1 Tax=Rathayibacter sp. VKM Ac-2630 TaxID=1938617 RepID=UPI0009D220D2|nr:hypothetical protein [Rathayibacter sp. VKM Ac-2630]OOB89630.1 hypothetical protein B0T42_16240 [Rathayibacter sp. VKM Ac-2630]